MSVWGQKRVKMATQLAKRKRYVISAGVKRDICRYKDQHPSASLETLSKHFGSQLGHTIGKSTLSEILKEKSKWLAIPENSSDLSRARNAKHQKMENNVHVHHTV